MHRERSIHYAALRAQNDVRHLVIEFVRGPAEAKLVQLRDGVEITLVTGTQAEVSDKAEDLINTLRSEGFQRQPLDQQHLVFETLKAVTALAQKMGYRTIYDQERYMNLDPRRGTINVTGEVPLEKWPGLITKSGGPYKYAFDHMRLHVQPTLTVSAERELAAIKDSLQFLKKAIELRNAQGPSAEFLLGGEFSGS